MKKIIIVLLIVLSFLFGRYVTIHGTKLTEVNNSSYHIAFNGFEHEYSYE